jgi:hypothetical protein
MYGRESLTVKPGVAWQQARLSSPAHGAGSQVSGSLAGPTETPREGRYRVMLWMELRTISLQPRLTDNSGWPGTVSPAAVLLVLHR